MIEEKRYLCEYCHAPFDNKNDCLKHEKNHKHPVNIQKVYYSNLENHPISILVSFDDESVVKYRFEQICKK